MGLFDNLESQAEAIAGKFGIPPEQVKAIVATLEAKLTGGTAPDAAVAQTAEQHDVPADKVQGVFDHLGGGELLGKLGGLGGLTKGLFG